MTDYKLPMDRGLVNITAPMLFYLHIIVITSTTTPFGKYPQEIVKIIFVATIFHSMSSSIILTFKFIVEVLWELK